MTHLRVITRQDADFDPQPEQTLEDRIRNALLAEAEAIERFAWKAAASCAEAVRLIASADGLLIISGVGKSGLIARKIAATFTSLGKPAVFLHPTEASHGDLGLLQKGSVVLMLSNSGDTAELGDLIEFCRANDHPMIALTGRAEGRLAVSADVAVVYGQQAEICPNGLAPTTSTTLCLAIGDAIATSVAAAAGITVADFRRNHPGGSLGQRARTVGDLMRHGADLPALAPGASIRDACSEMILKRCTVAMLRDEAGRHLLLDYADIAAAPGQAWQVCADLMAREATLLLRPELSLEDAAQAFLAAQDAPAAIVENAEGAVAGLLLRDDVLPASPRPC